MRKVGSGLVSDLGLREISRWEGLSTSNAWFIM